MDQERIDAIIMAYLKGTTTESEDRLLCEYLAESPEHQEYFARIRAVAHYLDTLPQTDKSEREKPRVHAGWKGTWWGWAAVILLLFSLAAFSLVRTKTDRMVYENTGGKTQMVLLPDRSRVWLSDGSSLSYNRRSFSRRRDVSLTGQAEFDVTKNGTSPFRVSTKLIEVTVLGTVFQVRDFPSNDHAEVTLAEGSIALRPLSSQDYFEVSVGQRAVYRGKDHMMTIEEVPVDQILFRRNGIMSIEKANIHQIVERIQSDFGVRLSAVSVGASPDALYTFSYPEKAPLEEILDMLEVLTGYRFEPDLTTK